MFFQYLVQIMRLLRFARNDGKRPVYCHCEER